MTERRTKQKLFHAEVVTPDCKSEDAMEVHLSTGYSYSKVYNFANDLQKDKQKSFLKVISLCMNPIA